MEEMDKVDQQQQREIQGLQNQDKIHTLLIKFIGIGFFTLILIILALVHLVLTQKIYVENNLCPDQEITFKQK